MVAWLEDQQQAYFAANPGARRFKLHNFRGLAMRRAKEMGVSYTAAATAFGCHPETMRRHYLALDEAAIADEVFDRLNAPKSKQGEISSSWTVTDFTIALIYHGL
jgi:hypothetical protein